MEIELLYIVLGVGIGLLIWFLFAKVFFGLQLSKARRQSVQQSKSTTLGYVNEKIAPLLPEFPYLFKDLTFVGKGIDYLVIDGLSEGDIKEIVLLEIKSGNSQLNKNERMIRDAVANGKVSYKVLRMK